MSKLSFVAIAALIAVPLVSSQASADTKALTAAQKTLSGSPNIVFGMNIGSITSSKLFQQMWPALQAKGGQEMKDGFELAQKQCGIDPLKAVSDIVVAIDKDTKKGVVFIGLNGIDQAKLESCAIKIGTAKKKPIPTFKKDGNVIEMAPGEKGRANDKKYYAWAAADVIVVSTDGGDKAGLAKWTGGKGLDAKTGVGALVAKTATTGAMWGAANVANSIQPGMDVKGGYGAVTMTGGTLNVDMHAIMADAKTATDAATKATTQLAAVASAKGTGLPPGIQKALQAMKISGVGSEVVIKAGLAEADVQMLLGLLMMKM